MTTLFALPADSDQPLHIVADSSTFNYKTGANSYSGNVKIDQGSTHVTADRVTTQSDSHHKIQEAFAYGDKQLAEYNTIPKDGDEVFHAKAKVIKFFPPKSIVICEGDALVTQGQNSFHGPIIIYNTKTQIVDAPASKDGRSTIIIQPDNLPKS
jgi:lipopolysaccharide export system protein LptA